MPFTWYYISSFCLCLIISFSSSCSFAQEVFRSELSLQNENDVYLFTGQDRYYTNGIHFQYSRAIDYNGNDQTKRYRKIWSLGLGQKLYNALGGNVYFIEEVDRPITGYLYLQGHLQWVYQNKAEEVLSLGAELATIGNTALGRPVQKTFHSLFNLYTISGWEYQLHSAWGIDMRLAYIRLLYRSQSKRFDIGMYGATSLGINNIYARVGPQFRLGRFNPLYSSVAAWNRVGSKEAAQQKELFFFYRPSLAWIGYDSTMEGGMLLQDKGPVVSEIKPWILSHQVGIHHSKGRIGLKLYYVFNSKQSESMVTRHQYGAVQFSYFY